MKLPGEWSREKEFRKEHNSDNHVIYKIVILVLP